MPGRLDGVAVTKGAIEELVTVVVPARNEANAIGQCLRSILDQDWPSLEVLVVDGDSTDDTVEIVRSIAKDDSRVKLLSNPDRIIPTALNIALARATSNWFVRVDAHASIPKDYVRIAHDLLVSGEFGAVGGRKDGRGESPAGKAIAAVMASRFGVGGSTYHYGKSPRDVEHVPFGAYPVELLRELNGWNVNLRVNQDFELDYRVRQSGRRIRFDPRLSISWHSRQTIAQLARQYFRYGTGKVQVAALHPGSLRARHVLPPALVLLLLGSAVVGIRRPKVGLAGVAPYITILALGTATISRRVDAEARPFVLPAMVAMHVSWGLGFWRGTVETLAAQTIRRWPRGGV